MSGRPPEEVWVQNIDEGERRLSRSVAGLAATGFAGGVEVLVGIVAMIVVSGAFSAQLGEQGAHVLGSLAFGIGFVLLTVGRAELFTENFLIPVSAVYARRCTVPALARLWGITLVVNLAGLALFAGIFSVHGVLTPETLKAAGPLADTYGDRHAIAALLSAIAAGTVMTLFTWVTAAADDVVARTLLALLIGFVLAAPGLNHAIVSFGELVLGIFAGTAHSDGWDVLRNLGLAIAGNLIGGVGLVFGTRLAQVRGEPT